MNLRTSIITAAALTVGIGLGWLIPGIIGSRSGLEGHRYFAVRPTATEIDFSDRPRLVGPIRGVGSQEIAFIEGDASLRIYLISRGKKELLHHLEVNSEWFRSVWFTLVQRESGKVGLVLHARSLLRSAGSNAIPKGYEDFPAMFERNWEYDLGKIASISASCNEHITTIPGWKPGVETPAISYQFFRDKEDFDTLATLGGTLFPARSDQAMIETSAKEPGLEFVLISVEAQPE